MPLAELRDGPLYRLADRPNPAVPSGRIGVYTVCHEDQLVYVGDGWFVQCGRSGYSMMPRLVVCQIHAQLRRACGVRSGHGLDGKGL
jgi:hypothetical protein